MPTKKIIISRFDGGISEDKRSTDASKFSLTKHFDIFSYPHKLVPYYKFQAFAGEDKALKIARLIYAPRDAAETTFKLWGLGIKNGGTTETGIYMQDPYSESTWSTPNNNEGSAARNTSVFFYYKQYIYVWQGGSYLARFDVTSGGAYSNTYQTITYTNLAEPVHHRADDIAYFFSDNNVHTLNAASWTTNALVLPSNQIIKSACEYGNYLAIGCITKGTFNVKTTVFLWDRDSSLNTLSERIDFGEGSLISLHNLDGKLTALMNYYGNNALANAQPKILVKQSSGLFGVSLQELIGDYVSSSNGAGKGVVKNGKIFFPASIQLNGDARFGVWAVDGNGKFTLALENPDATSIQDIYPLANSWWMVHSGDFSTDHNMPTAVDGYYSSVNPATYESLIINGGDSEQDKKLVRVSINTEPLPAAGQIVLKYRKNEETAWTTIYTDATDNQISHTAINIESTGANLPEFNEIQFQILSTGGAAPTGLKVELEEIDTGI